MMPAHDLSDDQVQTYTALMTAAAYLRRQTERLMQENHELTRVQFHILDRLNRHPEGLRMHTLADYLAHSRSGMTYQVSQLEKSGMVQRASNADNERAVVAQITELGAQVYTSVLADHRSTVKKHFLDVLTEDEQRTIGQAMSKVLDTFDRPRD
ncbi:MarR family winged helix-turn-helix transcriptional regulator [Auritidibacter ignavus]|uniref:MarR family winged helix-turn-helix transcriptional regulator n=1 Tax=Auritidibacter ignavus TaxID=678932 RepID=UPI00109C10F8|nr:MarR family transcriptional regulator [Auritidibacter ignavus]